MLSHFILTRFNLASPGREETLRSRTGWLDRRIALFEKYCLPSVAAQTNSNFKWLIYFDIRTPETSLHHFDEYARKPFIELRRVDGPNFSREDVRNDIVRLSTPGCDWVLTTRLDNDDAIGRTFVDTLQRAFEPSGRYVLNFPHGLILERGRIYRVTDRSNAFATLVEPADDVRTVWARQHTDLRLLAPLRQLGSEPMWLQVIHGDNVSNRKRGIRLSAQSACAANFPIAEHELRPVSRWELLKENAFDAPREWLVYHAKSAVRAGCHRVEMATGWSATEALRRLRERRR